MRRTPASVILETATYNAHPDALNPEFVVPEEVKAFIRRTYGLAEPGVITIDQFAGPGDFVDGVNRAGGNCHGIEIDPKQHELGKRRLSKDTTYILGDSTKTVTRQMFRGGYPRGLTSIPFTLIDKLAHSDKPDDTLARTLRMALHDEALLIIDSADEAWRDGRRLTPAADTVQYLTAYPSSDPVESWARSHFNLVATHRFKVLNPPKHHGKPFDSQFTELVFVPRHRFALTLGHLAINLGLEMNRLADAFNRQLTHVSY